MPQNGWLDFGFVLSLTKEKGFMDLNQVRYFLHLADTLNFTESARRAGVSQPSLTRAIQRLEEELGGPLLYRDGKDTRLTALGRDLQVEFMRIDHNLQQVRELAENSVNGRHRNLSIGVSTTITAHMFTQFFDMALEQLPGVQISLHPMQQGEDCAQILSGKYDACLLSSEPARNMKLETQALFEERYLVGCAESHPFAAQKTVRPEQLPHEIYVDRLFCEFHTQIVDYFMDRNILMRSRFASEREDWVQQFVANSCAICILPEHSGSAPGIVTRPVEGLELSRTIYLVAVSGSGTPIELRQIMKMSKQHDWSLKA
jgi:DNA-binding transcriptional LysR family regulator